MNAAAKTPESHFSCFTGTVIALCVWGILGSVMLYYSQTYSLERHLDCERQQTDLLTSKLEGLMDSVRHNTVILEDIRRLNMERYKAEFGPERQEK